VFPAWVFAQAHVVYPQEAGASWGERIVGLMTSEAFGKLTEPQEARVRGLLARAAKLLTGGRAISVGVGRRGEAMVFEVVIQQAPGVDVGAELKALYAEAEAVDGDLGQHDFRDNATTYETGGRTMYRFKGKGLCVDMAARGNVLMMTVAWSEERIVPEMTGMAMAGKTAGLCAGEVDVEKLVGTGAALGGPFAGMSPERLAAMKGAVAGQKVTWTVDVVGGKLEADVRVPKVVVREALKAHGLTGE
jgi:hypothetical protein